MQENNSVEDSMSVLDLISLKNVLEEYDVQTALLEKSEEMPLSSLVVNIADDYKGRTRTVSFSFVPLSSEYFPDIKIMQVYSEFNFSIAPEYVDVVGQLIVRLNRFLPLGSFGLSDSNGVYFRYVYTIPKFKNLKETEDVIINLVDLISYNLDINAKALEQVALGEKTLDAAMEEFMNE